MAIDDKNKNAYPSASIAQQVQGAGREVRTRAAGVPTDVTSFSGSIKPAAVGVGKPGLLTKAKVAPASPPALSQIRKPPIAGGQASVVTTGAPSAGPRDTGGGPGQESPGGESVRSLFGGVRPAAGTPMLSNSGGSPARWTNGGVDMTEEEISAYFKPSRAMGAQPALKEGTYLPMGGIGTGGMVNLDAGGASGAGSLFSGRPTMVPAQQQATQGSDIFGDTAKLFERRALLQSQMDTHYSKNPLGDDLLKNFNSIAQMSGQRKEIKEIGEQLARRDELVANLQGILMQGKNAMNVQGLQNEGQVAVQGMVGDQMMNRVGAESKAQIAGIDAQGKNAMSVQSAQDSAAMDRAKLTANSQEKIAAAGQKPYDYEGNQIKAGEAILKLLTSPDSTLTQEQKDLFEQTGMGMLLSGTGMNKPRIPKKR